MLVDYARREECEQRLRANLRAQVANLANLLGSMSDHWGYEDPVYRFYHQSYKVYNLQEQTTQIAEALKSLLPDVALNDWFGQIVREGTGREFCPEHNNRWLSETRPIVEAFFHARFFLEMACRYNDPPPKDNPLPSGWAALLYLFNLR